MYVTTAFTDRVLTGKVTKLDEDQHLVFGWAYVAVEKDGAQVTDHSGDFIENVATDYEPAAYDFVLHSREADAMHTEPCVGHLVESFVVTPEKLKAMGASPDALPLGHWIGYHIEDEAVWKRVKDGELSMFSIAGEGSRVKA